MNQGFHEMVSFLIFAILHAIIKQYANHLNTSSKIEASPPKKEQSQKLRSKGKKPNKRHFHEERQKKIKEII